MTILRTGWGPTIGIGVDDSNAHISNGYYRIELNISDDCDEQEITRVHAGSSYTDLRSIAASTSVHLTPEELCQCEARLRRRTRGTTYAVRSF